MKRILWFICSVFLIFTNISEATEKDLISNNRIENQEDRTESNKEEEKYISNFIFSGINSYPGVSNNYDDYLPSKYSFFFQFTSKTKWINENTGEAANLTITKNKNTQAVGKVIDIKSIDDVYRATNVGFYGGKSIDLIIGITYIKKNNYEPWFGDKIISSIELGAEETNFLDIYMTGDLNTEINFYFKTVESGTNTEVKTSGVISVENMTRSKQFMIQKDQINKLYATPTSKVQYDENSGMTINNYKLATLFQSTEFLSNGQEAGKDGQLVLIYDELSIVNIGVKSLERSSALLQRLNRDIPLRVIPPDPFSSQHLNGKVEKDNYRVVQFIPPQANDIFRSYELNVNLVSIFKPISIENIKVYNLSGEDITSGFEIYVDEAEGLSKVRAIAKPETLNNNLEGNILYNNYQILDIPVEIDYSKDFGNYINEIMNNIQIPSISTLIIDNFSSPFISDRNGIVSFASESNTTINYIDSSNRNIIPSDEYTNIIGTSKEYSAKDIDGFNLLSTENTILLKQELTPTIHNFEYDDQRFSSSIDIIAKNSPLEKDIVLPNDILNFDLKIKNNMENKYNINDGTIKIQHSSLLEEPYNFKVVNTFGESVGNSEYDGQFINVNLTPNIELSDEFNITWESKVKSLEHIDLNGKMNIKADFSIGVNGYNINYEDEIISKDYEVAKAGNLEFVVPRDISFGSIPTEKVKINQKMLESKNPWYLYDTSIVNNEWSIKVKLTKSGFVGRETKKVLPVTMNYNDGNLNFSLIPGQDNVIFSSKTYEKFTNYDFNNIWNSSENYGFFLTGGTSGVLVDDYSGTLEWSISLSEY